MAAGNGYFRPLLVPTLFLIVGLPVLLWLGTWQLQRLEWKLKVIQNMEERMDAPAVDIAGVAPALNDEYRRYRVSGMFLADHEFHWLTTSETYGIGYQLFSPFRLDDGRLVIINRGYMPDALKEPSTRSEENWLETGPESFEVIARVPETPGSLDGANDVAANIWLTRDTRAMCTQTGLSDCMALYLERDGEVADAVWPKPNAARVKLVNNHLDYALTWFGLAIVLIAIYLAFHKAQGRIGYARKPGDEL
jgi:surfeit locus 1 family protein